MSLLNDISSIVLSSMGFLRVVVVAMDSFYRDFALACLWLIIPSIFINFLSFFIALTPCEDETLCCVLSLFSAILASILRLFFVVNDSNESSSF